MSDRFTVRESYERSVKNFKPGQGVVVRSNPGDGMRFYLSADHIEQNIQIVNGDVFWIVSHHGNDNTRQPLETKVLTRYGLASINTFILDNFELVEKI